MVAAAQRGQAAPRLRRREPEEGCPVVHWLQVTGLGATPYFEMKGRLDTLKDEYRALEEKLAVASRGEQGMGGRDGVKRTCGEEGMGEEMGEEMG